MVLVTAVTLSGYEREKETLGAVSRSVNSRRVEVSQLSYSSCSFLSCFLSLSLSLHSSSLLFVIPRFFSLSLSALTFVGELAYVICLSVRVSLPLDRDLCYVPLIPAVKFYFVKVRK